MVWLEGEKDVREMSVLTLRWNCDAAVARVSGRKKSVTTRLRRWSIALGLTGGLDRNQV
jgi:hypothetical protein